MNKFLPQTRIAKLLCSLQDHVRDLLREESKSTKRADPAEVVELTQSDTIYRIDRVSEEAITAWFEENWPGELPVELVMEGTAEGGSLTFPKGTPLSGTEWKCLLDPIDGTRNLMYDKRSAWILSGVARQLGPGTSLRDIEVAAMTSIPTTREWRSDQLYAIREHGLVATAFDTRTGVRSPLPACPSRAADCRHGFATISRFFPDGLGLLGQLEEQLWNELYPDLRGRAPELFNDQYLASGGQLHELISGRDRFIADLRPLVFRKLGLKGGLACHPYDLSAVLVAEEAGVIVEDPVNGEPLDVPMDTTTPVSWAGYANETIAAAIRPVLKKLIRDNL